MNAIPARPEEEQQKPAELTGRQALLQEIGDKLSQSRSTSGESIDEAVRKLKIRISHLQALENGNWDKMPDDIYVIGFLRQYSQYLHVDLSDEIHRLKNDQYALTKPLTFPDPPVAPSRRWAWVAGAAFVLLFILFNVTTENRHMDNDNDAAEATGVVASADPTVDAASSLQTDNNETAADASQSIMPDSAAEIPSAETLPAKSPAKDTVIDTTITETPASEKSAPAGQMMTETSPAPDSGLATPLANPMTTPVQTQAVNSAMHHFRFDAVGSPVWLQISRPDPSGIGKGKLLKEVLLQPGFHTSIRAQAESLWITCGNAPALRITVDGSVFAAPGSLGAGKKVLRDYRFSIGSDN